MEIKKIVLEMVLFGERDKKKAMKIVSKVAGVNSISVEMKEKKMTVIGEVDPICMVRKLRKFRYTEIISVEPAKEEEEKEEKEEKEEDKVHEIFIYNGNNPFHYYVEIPYEQPPSCVIC